MGGRRRARASLGRRRGSLGVWQTRRVEVMSAKGFVTISSLQYVEGYADGTLSMGDGIDVGMMMVSGQDIR
jgi:hypothetical protein